jgi:hypothetical protein
MEQVTTTEDRRADLERRMVQIAARHGPWTAMSIALGEGLSTHPPGPDWRLARIVHILRDVLRRPLQGLRVLDLACLEGHYSVEPALHGADALGIEGRDDNLVKAASRRRRWAWNIAGSSSTMSGTSRRPATARSTW